MPSNGVKVCSVFTSMIKTCLISFILLFATLFFLVFPSIPSKGSRLISHRSLLQSSSSSSCSSVLDKPVNDRCNFSKIHCAGDSNGFFNYFSLHFCIFNENPFFSIPFLSLIILFQFYFLVETAQSYFSIVVRKLSIHLNLSPSMGAVTLLSLGNGAPDVFASIAAVRGGHARTGLGAILSAGTFVTAFVVGFVAIYASPFNVEPSQFIRDVFFYLIASSSLFYIYLSAEIFLWQAVGFVGFYLFFVVFVFWMDIVVEKKRGKDEIEVEMGLLEDFQSSDCVHGVKNLNDRKIGVLRLMNKVTVLWEVPVSVLLKLTIPSTSLSEWNRFYIAVNIAICPIILSYSIDSFIPMNQRIVFLLPHIYFPIWTIIFSVSFIFGLAHYLIVKKPPESEEMPASIFAFVMSVFWISTVAGELLNCLASIGSILKLPPSILGLTVLAWGNSVGDLVSDVAVAKAGQPAMAIAGCFAGPMFNMLVGLGTALVIQTADIYPGPYKLQFHVSIVVAFVFLLLSLMGSLLVVTWSRFRVPRIWGYCLVCLYIVFICLSLVIAKVSR